jgi:hypothetical protein
VSLLDAAAHRLSGMRLAADYVEPSSVAGPVVGDEPRYHPRPEFVPDSEFHKTREEVADAEGAVLDELADLAARLDSWWQACQTRFNPISEGDPR